MFNQPAKRYAKKISGEMESPSVLQGCFTLKIQEGGGIPASREGRPLPSSSKGGMIMGKRLRDSLRITAVAIFFVFFAFLSAFALPDTAQVSFNPSTSYIVTGGTETKFSVDIVVDENADSLTQCEIGLSCDKNVLAIDSVSKGSIWSGSVFSSVVIDSVDSNRVFIIYALLGSDAYVNGPGVLAKVRFRTRGPGETDLVFDSLTLRGSLDHPIIPSKGINGKVYVDVPCLVSPSSLNFNTICVGGYLDKTFTIRNTGGGTLSGTVSEVCADYSLMGSTTYSLTIGQSKTFTVRFQPTSSGVKTCTIETGNGACIDVSCTGTGDIVPSAPTNCTASDTLCDKVHFCWQDNSNNETGFKIYRNGGLIGSVGANVTCYDDTSGTPGTTYSYCVKAYNNCGESSQCCDNGTRLAFSGAPTNCTASDTLCGKVHFCWQDNSSNEAGFKIYRNDVLIGSVGVNVTCYDDTTGTPGQTYNYCVKAYNNCGESSQCCDNGTRLAPPSAPTNCVASDTLCDKVHFCWQDNSSNETGFKIYRNSVLIGSVGANVICYDDTSGTPGQTYNYCVKAYDNCGESSQCCDNGTRLAPPSTPTSVTAECITGDGGYIHVCWSNVEQESKYYVYRNGFLLDSVLANVTCYDDDNPGSGVWCYQISSHNPCGTSTKSDFACDTFPCTPCPSPVCFEVISSTGESYSIVVDSALLDGLELEDCDEIGVFADTGGGLLCVGASVYHPYSLPIPLVAWKDDPLTPWKDGYTSGDTMYFKVCHPSKGRVECAQAHYSVGNGRFEFGLYSQLWLEAPCLIPPCDDIVLHSGWQWISTNVDPDPCEMESIFVNCWFGHLDIIIACDGSFCIPGISTCWIDCWNACEGYKVHMADACTIQVCGPRVPIDQICPLHEGWNCIAYFPECPLEPETALVSIWDNLDLVKNDDGDFCIPGVGCWIDCMESNEGYKAHLASADTLIYPTDCPPCPPPLAKVDSYHELVKSTHFSFVEETGESYSIVVNSVDITGKLPEVGDEIGVFTPAGLCVGGGVWQGGILGLAVWQDDEETGVADGFQVGEQMVFKLWDKSENKAIELSANFDKGDGRFGTAAYALVDLTGGSAQLPQAYKLSQNYPNPFNPETEIGFFVPVDSRVAIKIYNVAGQLVKVYQGYYPAGNHTITWDATNLKGEDVGSGIYFYRMEAGNFAQQKKMILMR